MSENTIPFQKKNKKKKSLLLEDSKLACFSELFESFAFGIDLNKFDFSGYTRPDLQIRSVVFGMVHTQLGRGKIDLRTNAIYNFLDTIKEKCDFDPNSKNLYRADLIILNIASQLFDRRFANRKLDPTNQKDIRDTIAWSNDPSRTNQLAVFYHAYVNADLETCQMIEPLFDDNYIKYYELTYNVELFSSSFIQGLSKETYHHILNAVINTDGIFAELKDEFYQNAKALCEINPNFFSSFGYFRPFFYPQIKDALAVFSLEEFASMSESELSYIAGEPKQRLEKMKPFLDLNVEPSKIDKVLCYPAIIQMGYRHFTLIKNQISNPYNPNKVLMKK